MLWRIIEKLFGVFLLVFFGFSVLVGIILEQIGYGLIAVFIFLGGFLCGMKGIETLYS